jgi:hypothetical protein
MTLTDFAFANIHGHHFVPSDRSLNDLEASRISNASSASNDIKNAVIRAEASPLHVLFNNKAECTVSLMTCALLMGVRERHKAIECAPYLFICLVPSAEQMRFPTRAYTASKSIASTSCSSCRARVPQA